MKTAETFRMQRVEFRPPAAAEVAGEVVSQLRTRFERLLIFILCLLWGVGVVVWALTSLLGMRYGGLAAQNSSDLLAVSPFSPAVLYPVTMAVRLILGF